MARKRIIELTDASDTQGQYAGIDASGSSSAEKVLWPHHYVSALPSAPNAGMLYYLSASSGNYPTGLYSHDGTGWFCIFQTGMATLTAWTGDVSDSLVSGVTYDVTVSGAVTSLDLTISTTGSAIVATDNTSGSYAITGPTGVYKRGSIGLDDLSTDRAEITITKSNYGTIWSSIEVVSV